MEPRVCGPTLASQVVGQGVAPGSAVSTPGDCGRGLAGVAHPHLGSLVRKGGGGEGGKGTCPLDSSPQEEVKGGVGEF